MFAGLGPLVQSQYAVRLLFDALSLPDVQTSMAHDGKMLVGGWCTRIEKVVNGDHKEGTRIKKGCTPGTKKGAPETASNRTRIDNRN